MRRAGLLLLTLLPAIIMLIAWELAVQGSQRGQFLYAAPSLIAKLGWSELQTSAFYIDIGTTLSESVLGLLGGLGFGTLAGLLLWGNGRADRIIKPYVILLGAVPVFALAPVFILWFGIGLLSKAIMAGFAVFFVSLVQAYNGAHNAADQYAGFARSIKAPHLRLVQKIIIPGALEWVFSGIKISVGLALTGAFIAEFVSSEQGLGHYILTAGSLYDMPRVFWGVLVLAVIALALTTISEVVQRKIRK